MAGNEVNNWTKFGYVLSTAGFCLGLYGVFRRPQAAAQAAALPPSQRVLHPGDSFSLVGDSIGVGMQHPLNDLSNAYGTFLTSHVKVGTTIGYWAKLADDSWGAYKAVILCLGSNDAAGKPEAEATELASLLQRLRAYGALVFWLRPPSFNLAALKPGQAAVEQLFWDAGVPALELYGPPVGVAGDPMKLHPSPQGYKTLAAQTFDALTRGALALPRRSAGPKLAR